MTPTPADPTAIVDPARSCAADHDGVRAAEEEARREAEYCPEPGQKPRGRGQQKKPGSVRDVAARTGLSRTEVQRIERHVEADLAGIRALAAAVVERAWLDALSPPPGKGGRPDYGSMRDARDFLLTDRCEPWLAALPDLDPESMRERLLRQIEAKREQRRQRKKEQAA